MTSEEMITAKYTKDAKLLKAWLGNISHHESHESTRITLDDL